MTNKKVIVNIIKEIRLKQLARLKDEKTIESTDIC